MSLNRFINTDCSFLELAAIQNQDCRSTPRRSEISTLILLPDGAKLPNDWTSYESMIAVIDNSILTNQYGKMLIGRGEIQEGTQIGFSLGKRTKAVGYKKQLVFDFPIITAQQYDIFRRIQRGALSYSFWFGTLGGRLYGGSKGIKPIFSSGDYAFLKDDNSVEYAKLIIEWIEDGATPRADHFQLLDVDVPFPVVVVLTDYYYQSYDFGDSLTWTENNGQLPQENTEGQFLLFLNGQKLIENTNYTLSANGGFNQSTINVADSVAPENSKYEAILLKDVNLYQKFTTGPELAWTENNGDFPETNTKGKLWVFQNGQKLAQGQSYTLQTSLLPNESTIAIESYAHFPGSTYEVFLIEANTFYQSFNGGTNTLTWTENGGILPNNKAKIFVFQNGQKLKDGESYTITGSNIFISSLVHFPGSFYEVITIE